MKRPHRFRPSDLVRLEARVVPSQTYFSPPTGVLVHGKVVKAVPAPPVGYTVRTVSRAVSAEDGTEAIDLSTYSDGVTFTNSTEVIRNADGTKQTEQETGTISGNTTNFTKAITLAIGAQQTETGTDVTVGSVGKIRADGTVQTGASPTVMIRTTTFHHVTTQPGLGTQAITGTTVQGKLKGHLITATDQEVIHFDGTTDSVHILTTGIGASSTTQTTTTPAGGSPSTTNSSTKLLSVKHS